MPVEFKDLESCDLVVDEIYGGAPSSNQRYDAITKIFPRLGDSSGAPNSSGFRLAGSHPNEKFCCLYSSGNVIEWPDHLDLETGEYTYYGDNRQPGHELHSKRGNRFLRTTFQRLHEKERSKIAPIFVFHRYEGDRKRAVVFKGLAVPGATGKPATEDLVAVWKSSEGQRFQNYRATFTILDVAKVSRAWIADVTHGTPQTVNAPQEWAKWIKTGSARALCATPVSAVRTREEQLPVDPFQIALLSKIRNRFSEHPYGFERVAAYIMRLSDPKFVRWEMTRFSADGGRDATGKYLIGPGAAAFAVDCALEAKCYAATNQVGVREVSRLISRLRHRQFGILATTSYLGDQAYREIIEDRHPVVVVAARDIAQILVRTGNTDIDELVRNAETVT